jgi:dihydroxy-acid dehydratase
LITDGRFSGGTRGPCFGHVAPEAAAGGPIALVEEGDSITIDLHQNRMDLDVAQDVLELRRTNLVIKKKSLSGVLSRYAAAVCQADRGAVLKKE